MILLPVGDGSVYGGDGHESVGLVRINESKER